MCHVTVWIPKMIVGPWNAKQHPILEDLLQEKLEELIKDSRSINPRLSD